MSKPDPESGGLTEKDKQMMGIKPQAAEVDTSWADLAEGKLGAGPVNKPEEAESKQEAVLSDSEKLEAQQTAYNDARVLYDEAHQTAIANFEAQGLTTDNISNREGYDATREILKPKLEALKSQGKMIEYLALKGTQTIGAVDVLRGVKQEDWEILTQIRKFLTTKQNEQLDASLENIAKETNDNIAAETQAANITRERFLADNPRYLNQPERNALEFIRNKTAK